jgi:hypothetical protein
MTPRRLRLVLLAAGLLGAALVLGAWTQPWAQIALTDGRALPITGQDAAPAVSGIALAAVALVAALMIARPRLRIVLGIVQLALGAIIVALVAPQLLSSDAALRTSWPVISEATGIAGGAADSLIQTFAATGWPVAALAGGAVIGLAGLAVILSARRWPAPTAKYETAAASTESTAGAWDALSEGDDPTTR